MRAPTSMWPASTRWPPNHSTPTVATLATIITVGNIAACQRPARIATSVSATLASAKRAVSCSSRTNARTTRTPVICSRSSRLTSSMRSCISRKLGTIWRTIRPMEAPRTGTTASTSHDRPTSSRSGHDDAADHHDRRRDHQRAAHQHEHLHLLDVVGLAGDQRRGAEVLHLARGERRRRGGRSRRAGRGRSPSRCGPRTRPPRSRTRPGPATRRASAAPWLDDVGRCRR